MKETKNNKETNKEWLDKMAEKELIDFHLTYQDEINDAIEDGDIEGAVKAIFECDWNYKHADPTTKMYVYDEATISSMLDDVLIMLCKEDDRCPECGCLRQDDDYISAPEPRPCGEGVCYENVVIAWRCNKCSYEEEY